MQLSARQAQHCTEILKVRTGDSLSIGIVDQRCGKALVEKITENKVWLRVDLDAIDQEPPPAAPVILYLALPRPKMLRRMLRTVAELGIKQLHIINTVKVEKSYWQSPSLRDENIEQYFLEGLEQAKDTVLPDHHLHKLFKPFVEDELPILIETPPNDVWVAHTGDAETSLSEVLSQRSSSSKSKQPLHLFIGPEGGFNRFEIDCLAKAGARSFNAGSRVFRTETFLPWILGALNTEQL